MISRLTITNGVAFCLVAAAVLTTQMTFLKPATADQSRDLGGDVKQRIVDLEEHQDENDQEFGVIDRALNDLNVRVDVIDVRGILDNSKKLNATEKRLRDMEDLVTELQQQVRDLQASLKGLTSES